jgi:basic membrane protein A and related proteins
MTSRRSWLTLVASLLVLACAAPGALAQSKLKVAAVYTVPVEQQWVSRIHKALNAAKERGEIDYVFSEKVANADYERVMREFAEKGNQLIVGESFAVETAARKVAKDYPKGGSSWDRRASRSRPTSPCSTTTSRSPPT